VRYVLQAAGEVRYAYTTGAATPVLWSWKRPMRS